MTWIFQTMSGKPGMVNEYASRIFSTEPQSKFSDVFSPFFGNISSNMLSWIDVFSNHFDIDQVKNDALHNWRKSAEGESVNKTVDEMFTQLMNKEDLEQAHQDVDEQNIRRLKQVYICLFYIYKLLEQLRYNRKDAPFNFMNGFSIQETRVVILGNEPAEVDSSGYAFHESNCFSTKKLLGFINLDLKVLSKYCHNDSFQMTDDELKVAQSQCSFQGLINQGVLFMNIKFTPDQNNKLKGALEIPTDFLLEYLSKQSTPNVFILVGRVAWRKERLIDTNANLCLKVHHPSFYSHRKNVPIPMHDWCPNFPLINANFFLYQTKGKENMIDWSDISSGIKPGKEQRLESLDQAFNTLCSSNSNSFSEYFSRIRTESGHFYLRKPNQRVSSENNTIQAPPAKRPLFCVSTEDVTLPMSLLSRGR